MAHACRFYNQDSSYNLAWSVLTVTTQIFLHKVGGDKKSRKYNVCSGNSDSDQNLEPNKQFKKMVCASISTVWTEQNQD
jgi:hypothetical protein